MQINENIATRLDDVNIRIGCAVSNAHLVFAWFSECSSATISNFEADALYSTISNLDALSKELHNITTEIWKTPDTVGEQPDNVSGKEADKIPAWAAAEKKNQKKNGYEPIAE